MSNNSTIDELRSSLAEAQKYSFRAIINNRASAHHPTTVPVGYQGFQQQTTLSQYLKENDRRDSRSRSNSPYRFDQCPVNQTVASGSKLQESYISMRKTNVVHSQTMNTVHEEEQHSQAHSSAQVRMPLTDYYNQKFSGTSERAAPEVIHVYGTQEGENQFMAMAQQ